MRIVIDLQGRQSSGSKNRGIGRYSLSISQAIVRNKKNHEVIIVLSSLFPEEVEIVKEEFKGLLPKENIRIWEGKDNYSYLTMEPGKRKTAELSRELFLHDLNPDVIYITSLFEGLDDAVTTSVGTILSDVPTAVTLYDLIPLINEKPYLDNPAVKEWYFDKIEHLKRADLLLAISESSRQEALEYLKFHSDEVVNIGTAADQQFKKITVTKEQRETILNQYNIESKFLMYTGGIDLRKNIEGLIRSYALLPEEIRKEHQLAIVCSINEQQESDLSLLAEKVGLDKNEVIFTGFISEEDLIALYNLCKAFVFPSWHEGFGLPVLEAMWCGAPVIVANTSSLPEVIGLDDALFDPYDDQSIANKIELVLTDDAFRQKLIDHASNQIKIFSWDISAQKAITAFESVSKINKLDVSPIQRLKLAYVSPLPPERSGISDYSAELLPGLHDYYDIDVVVEQEEVSDKWVNTHCNIIDSKLFRKNAVHYDRVVYHFGNSHFHQHMFNLLMEIPGVVVLHDFYLSGALNYMSTIQYENHSFEDELFYSHGNAPFNHDGSDLVMSFPCNKKVLDYAKGIVVHSANSIKLAKEWYGKTYATNWHQIPLLRESPATNNQIESRIALNIPKDAVVIATFGGISSTKLNLELLEAWLDSPLSLECNSYLIFVGGNDVVDYGREIETLIESSSSASRIIITDWVDAETFKRYLSASDIGVQLRTLSRGETSAAVLDCMNYGLATIVNANGSMADLSQEGVLMIPDNFTHEELKNALESLYFDKKQRNALSLNAVNIIEKNHSPNKCANQYAKSIETHYSRNTIKKEGILEFKAKAINAEAKVLELETAILKANAETHEWWTEASNIGAEKHKWWLKATEAEVKVDKAETKAHEWWVKSTEAEAKAKERETMNHDMIRSTSWRLTGPFRFFGRFTKIMLSSASVKHKCYLVIKSLTYRVKRVPFLRKYIVKIFFKFPKLHEIYNNKLNVTESEKIKAEIDVIDCLNTREQKIYNDIQLSLYKRKK